MLGLCRVCAGTPVKLVAVVLVRLCTGRGLLLTHAQHVALRRTCAGCVVTGRTGCDTAVRVAILHVSVSRGVALSHL